MDPLLDLFNGEEGRGESLPPEVEEGNIEYKLKLIDPSTSRFEHLVTQLKWRLQEGQGEAIYEIGVADCGTLMGLNDKELSMSLDTLMKMSKKLGATATVLRKREVLQASSERLWVAEVLVRKVPDDQQFLDIRLAVLGNMEAGKSTLLGVLTQGELDNGRGKARLNLFRHLHEIQSGHTSSISHEIVGLTSQGTVVNYSTHNTAEDICSASAKLIIFTDLAGHHKYLKTTVFGLTARRPDFAMLVVGANSGVVGTTCEHLGFCIALQLPILVVITKIDLCSPEQIETVSKQLEEILTNPGCNKIPKRIKTENDVYAVAQRFGDKSVCPIFLVSNVTGQNMELITKFLNAVPKQVPHQQLEQQPMEFQVNEIYSIPEVGVVVGGTVTCGTIREGDRAFIGPDENCQYREIHITSIQRYRLPCRLVKAGQTATLAINGTDKFAIRKGTVLLDSSFRFSDNAMSCWQFSANIVLLHPSGGGCGLRKGSHVTLYIASTMQTAIIENIENEGSLLQGQKVCVHFKFQRHPEFLRMGWRVLFHEGQTKGIGEITKLVQASSTTN